MATNRPQAIKVDKRIIAERRVNKMFDNAAKPKVERRIAPRRQMAVRTGLRQGASRGALRALGAGMRVADVPIDLTGYDARMQIREKRTSSTFIEELTVGNGGITLGGALGTIALLIDDATTAGYTFKTAVYDLEIISAGSIVTRLLQGTVTLSTEATK